MMTSLLWLAATLTQAEAPWPVKAKFQMPEEHGGMFVLAISPDAKVVAGGTGIVTMTIGNTKSVKGGDIVLWDPATGKIRKILGKHGATPSWLSFSRDGKLLGSLSKEDGEFKLWDLGTGKLAQTMKLSGINADAAAVAFDGRTLVTVEQKSIPTGREGSSYLYPGALAARDAKTGKTLWSLPDSGVVVLGLSPDGKTLAVFIQKQTMNGEQFKITERAVKLLDALTGKELRTLERGDLSYADAIGFPQDGKTVYALHRGSLHRWDAQEGKPQPAVALEGVNSVKTRALSADGRMMAIVEFMGERAGLIDTTSGKTVVDGAFKSSSSIWHPTFSSDLRLMACTINFETVLLSVPAPK